MSRALLDVNVLLALLDAEHLDHDRAWAWADTGLARGWASCAITENGFVRILSQPRYPNPLGPHQAVLLLRTTRDGSDHEFWPCDLSVLDDAVVDSTRLHGHRQLTDAYLLALAVARGGRLVTLDRRLALDTVPGASEEALVVL